MSETFQYRRAMLNGTVMERADMIVADRSYQARQAKEQSQGCRAEQRGKEQQV